jgi:hypothetical protein
MLRNYDKHQMKLKSIKDEIGKLKIQKDQVISGELKEMRETFVKQKMNVTAFNKSERVSEILR